MWHLGNRSVSFRRDFSAKAPKILNIFILMCMLSTFFSCSSTQNQAQKRDFSTTERRLYHSSYRQKNIFESDKRATGITGFYLPMYFKSFD